MKYFSSVMLSIIGGVMGTFLMDVGNFFLSKIGLIHAINYSSISALINSWARLDFFHGKPSDLAAYSLGWEVGMLLHYMIGIFFAEIVFRMASNALQVFLYALLTTFVSLFIVYPSIGIEIFNLGNGDTNKLILTSVANHTFYATGVLAFFLIYSRSKGNDVRSS